MGSSELVVADFLYGIDTPVLGSVLINKISLSSCCSIGSSPAALARLAASNSVFSLLANC